MKIAIFTDVFLEVSGGITSSIMSQKESLKKLGHKVTVFCPGWEKHKSVNGFAIIDGKVDEDIVIVPTAKLLSFGGAPRSRRPRDVMAWVKIEHPEIADYDLVHVHYEAACSIAGMLLARDFDLPLIQTMHGREDMAVEMNIPHPLKTIVASSLCRMHAKCIPHTVKVKKDKQERINITWRSSADEMFKQFWARHSKKRFLLAPTKARAKMWTLMVNHANFADMVLTPSQHFANKLGSYGVVKPIVVVSNGIADDVVGQYESFAEKQNIPLVRKLKKNEPLRLFWNSRVSREKRIMPFLRALTHVDGDYMFTVCGDGNDLMRAKLFVKQHHMESKVEFLGQVQHDRVLEYMVSQDLSVTVSYGFDTQGMTLLEAEATGLPVFFCDPDMREVVPKDGSIMAKSPDVKQMVNALNKIFDNREMISKMSRVMLTERKAVMQSTQTDKLLDVYNQAISAK